MCKVCAMCIYRTLNIAICYIDISNVAVNRLSPATLPNSISHGHSKLVVSGATAKKRMTADDYYTKMVEIEKLKLEEMKRHNAVKEAAIKAKQKYQQQVVSSLYRPQYDHVPQNNTVNCSRPLWMQS